MADQRVAVRPASGADVEEALIEQPDGTLARRVALTQDDYDGIGGSELQEKIYVELQTLDYLRRIVRLMESQGVVDVANRQRISIDAIASGLLLATITTVSTLVDITRVAGMNQEMYINQARIAYNTGIRAKLT